MLSLELISETMPAGKALFLDVEAAKNQKKEDFFTIKEGIEYKSVRSY